MALYDARLAQIGEQGTEEQEDKKSATVGGLRSRGSYV
jgi:hypothetical protein